jgi:hypothetical protein
MAEKESRQKQRESLKPKCKMVFGFENGKAKYQMAFWLRAWYHSNLLCMLNRLQ